MNRFNSLLINRIVNKSFKNSKYIIGNNRLLNKNIIYSNTILNNNINNNINKFNNKLFSTSTTSNNNNNNNNENDNENDEEFIKELKSKIEITISLLNQDISKDVNEPSNYISRGKLYQYNSQHDEASKDFNKVLELTTPSNQLPNDAKNFGFRNDAYHGLALIQHALGNYDRAIEIIDEGFKENTVSVVQFVLKGDSYLKKSNYFKAQHCYALAFKSINKESDDVYVRQFSYSITELLVDCHIRMLENFSIQSLKSPSPSIEIIQSIIKNQIPEDQIKHIKSENKSFNQLLDKSKLIVQLLDQAYKSSVDQVTQDEDTKKLFECLISLYMAISYSSMEAIKFINNKDYNNHNLKKVDQYLLKCFEKSTKEFF